jgi:hypothetical protein
MCQMKAYEQKQKAIQCFVSKYFCFYSSALLMSICSFLFSRVNCRGVARTFQVGGGAEDSEISDESIYVKMLVCRFMII